MKLATSLSIATTLLTLSLGITSAHAGTNTPRLDQRQNAQEKRIEQGVNSGSLTEKEANRLEHGQERIEKMEERAKSDGVVTPAERKRMEHASDVQNRRIARQKHDAQGERGVHHDNIKHRRERAQH
jgi:hypothetical protein